MNIGQAINAQARIVYSVAIHDTKSRTAEHPLGVLSSLVEPLMTLLVMNLVMYYVRVRNPRMGDYLMLMVATGLLPVSAFRNSVNGGRKTMQKLRKILVLPTLRPLDLMLGGILTNTVALCLLFALIAAWFHFVMDTPEPQAILMAMVPFFCNACIGFGFCSLNSVIEMYFPFWRRIFATITIPLPMCSGLFYTADTMPAKFGDYLWWNPFLHSTELCRTFFFVEFESDFFSPAYYFGWVFGALFVGLALERIYRDKLASVG